MPKRRAGPPPSLPVEIYQDIFQRAIGSSQCEYDQDRFWQDTYMPFAHCQTISKKSNAPTRCTLLLVCQLWHSVGQKIAYETIFVGKHAPSLLAALTRSAKKNKGAGYGQFVRKIVFCARDKQGANKTTLTRLLAACPNVTTIVREAQDFSTFPISLPSFSSLHRLDWWGYYRPGAEETGRCCYKLTPMAINTTSNDLYLFRDIIAASPNLQYLSIGVERCSQPGSGEHKVASNPDDPLVVPVTTFRLETTVPWITRDIAKWSFPNLENLIINSQNPVNTVGSRRCSQCQTSSRFPHSLLSDRIRKLEIIGHPEVETHNPLMLFPSRWPGHDTSMVLSKCKNITELAINFSSTVLSKIVDSSSPTIQLDRLHTLRLKMRLRDWDSVEWARKQWGGITPERLPALRRVILFGEGRSFRLLPPARPALAVPLYGFFLDLSKRMGPGVTFLDEGGQTCIFDQSCPAMTPI